MTAEHKLRDRGGGGLKIVQICVTSFLNSPLPDIVVCLLGPFSLCEL